MKLGRPRPIETVSPVRREQADGEVERLVDDHVVGGAHEVGLHLLGHRDDAVAHDLGQDRIDLWRVRFVRFALVMDRFLPSLTASDADDQVAEGIDGQAIARPEHRGRRVLLDQRRAGDAIAGQQLVARIGRASRRTALPKKALRLPVSAARGGVRAAALDLLLRRLAHEAGHRRAQADDLGGLFGALTCRSARGARSSKCRLIAARSCFWKTRSGRSTVTGCSCPT